MAAGIIAATAAAGLRRAEQRKRLASCPAVFAAFAAHRKLAFATTDQKAPDGVFALPRASGAIAGMAITVEVAFDAAGWAHTRAIADSRAPADIDVAAHPNPPGLFGKLRTLLGNDVVVGSEPFDELFVVRSTPADVAPKLLEPARCAALVSWLTHQVEGFRYERGHITLVWSGAEDDGAVLDTALAFVDDVASWRLLRDDAGYRG